MNRAPFGIGEWYHCYTRGVDKRKTFQTTSDYHRFMQLLYLANTSSVIHRSDIRKRGDEIYAVQRAAPLVSIAAFCIMPNHFHLLLQEINEGGIAKFMQKVGTSYAMYFNIKNARVGNLFIKPFRSKHVNDDEYLQHLARYIHLNPAELFEPRWKEGRVQNMSLLEKQLLEYRYSSLMDHAGHQRAARAILDQNTVDVLREDTRPLREVLDDAAEYYRTLTL